MKPSACWGIDMTNTSHTFTPGPWHRSPNKEYITDDHNCYVAQVTGSNELAKHTAQANARLIAASPLQHEALENGVRTINYVMSWLESELKIIEERCDRTGITGAHKQSDMLGIGVVIENLKDMRARNAAAIAKAKGEV